MNEKKINLYNNLDTSNQNNKKEVQNVYRKWAANYDNDSNILGTVSPFVVVKLLTEEIKEKNLKIIDIGCGTGAVGLELKKKGFCNFDGVDISPEMIAQASNKGYHSLLLGDINESLPFEKNSYDVALSAGLFTHGHAKADKLSEIIRIVKPSGIICFTINEDVYLSDGFDSKIKTLEKNKEWKILVLKKKDYMVKKGVKGIYCLAKVLEKQG